MAALPIANCTVDLDMSQDWSAIWFFCSILLALLYTQYIIGFMRVDSTLSLLPFGLLVCAQSAMAYRVFVGGDECTGDGLQVMGGVCFAVVLVSALAALINWRKARKVFDERMAEIEGALPDVLADGTIRVVSTQWLLKRPARYILQRRQDLEDAAFLPVAQAVQLLRAKRLAALSYRWLSREHPDPDAFHLEKVRKCLATRGAASVAGIIVDFASLPQKDANGQRTPAEQATFAKGLGVMANVYASPNTLVLQQKALPSDGETRVPYERSGWCTFEESVASLATERGGNVHVIGVGRKRVKAGVRASAAEMEAWFHDPKTHFFGKADRETVAKMYADLLSKVTEFDRAHAPKIVVNSDELLAKCAPSHCAFVVYLTCLAASAAAIVANILGVIDGKEGGYPLSLILFVCPWGLFAFPVIFARDHGVSGRLRRLSAKVAPQPN